MAEQERLARQAELEQVEKERQIIEAELERVEKERLAGQMQEQARQIELAQQERLARQSELEGVEKERLANLAEQERLAKEAASKKREIEWAEQARHAALLWHESLAKEAELEKIENERQAEQQRLAKKAKQEWLEKERLDLLSRQKKRDSLLASWREKLGVGGEDAQRYQKRIDALNEVGGPVTPLALTESAYAMLENFDLDQEEFKPFFDHAIQQVLENEFVTIANDVAPLYGNIAIMRQYMNYKN